METKIQIEVNIRELAIGLNMLEALYNLSDTGKLPGPPTQGEMIHAVIERLEGAGLVGAVYDHEDELKSFSEIQPRKNGEE
jgi:hypothetical protein